MERLSLILWRERELLELLAYKLELEQLVLASGRSHWLAQANREVEDILSTLRETELLRAVAADAAAYDAGLEPNPSLSSLAEVAEEPWKTILVEHRDAFRDMTRDITALAEANRGLITAGYRSARETLLALGGSSTERYTPSGAAVSDTQHRRLVDRSL